MGKMDGTKIIYSFFGECSLCGSYSSSSSLGCVGNVGSCYYGLRAIILTFRARKNSRRKFLRCPKYKLARERCDYFLWVDYENYEKLRF